MRLLWGFVLTLLARQCHGAAMQPLDLPPLPAGYSSPGLPPGKPLQAPAYMVNNQGNTHGAAPDKGSMNGPILSQANLTALLQHKNESGDSGSHFARQKRASDFWMDGISHGQMPYAPSGYQFYRNVLDFGAKGDGITDDTEAINRAMAWYSLTDSTLRCGQTCGSTTTLGALVYFPAGTYLISTPIIQYYYTQFVGDPNNRPTIKGTQNFTGIALIDTDVYIPGGNGSEWYINQNQFFRQIRNFRFDLTAMNWTNYDNGQEYMPTGIHWQVAQGTSLQNLYFDMPVSTTTQTATAVGIFMENGSGGFLSDLVFFGGNIGFRAGSQQYTARSLHFTSCLTAISMIWNWGFVWKDINVLSCWIALDCTSVGGEGNQATGSITVIDSHFSGVPYAITLRSGGPYPSIVLDNLLVDNSASVVLVSGGATVFAGSSSEIYFESWAMGTVCDAQDGTCSYQTGLLSPTPVKPLALLNSSGDYFQRSRPQYENNPSFIAVTAHGIANDGTGDQSGNLNTLLAGNIGTPIFFPAGVYTVLNTVFVPKGSILVGEGWSQIMAEGPYFQNASNPQVMLRVGNPGDFGVLEMSDLLFTVRGPTAGAILVEWNIQQGSQGSAGMWDCHFRVGGAQGTNLQLSNCPASGSISEGCMAASLLLHLTPESSGYFENVWAWVADHDMDNPLNALVTEGLSGVPENVQTDIAVYGARGILIESQGPTWFWGTASEHSVMYQYQLYNAQHVFLAHMQTESPYYQPSPGATEPYTLGGMSSDPGFSDCEPNTSFAEAWALRVIASSDIFIYGAGFYQWFSNSDQGCLPDESCQLALIETSYIQGLWLYDLFTKGAEELVSPLGGIPPTLQKLANQTGYTSEIAAWLVLALGGGNIGDDDSPGASEEDGSGVVYIGSAIYVEPSPTVQCYPPCTLLFPVSPLSAVTTFPFAPTKTTLTGNGVTTVTTLTPSPLVTSVVSFWSESVSPGDDTFTFALTTSISPSPTTVTVGGVPITITFPPTSARYSGASTSGRSSTSSSGWPFPVLPTTVYSSGSITQTFSEDQDTSLRTITGTTTITTTWTETSSGTTSTTVVPVVVGPGGFYWSPIPLPTGPKFPFPGFPKLPPIPTPHCFKFLDIFSIDCPPNKHNPTTHFSSGPPSPTCTDCSRSESESDEKTSTTTCETLTMSTCDVVTAATPRVTNCYTFVGCECPTDTVTNEWVSCSGTACVTTSVQVTDGCYLTASTTTAGAYCPVPTYDESLEDLGDALPDGVTITTTSVSLPPSVVVGGSTYPASGSVVVVDGTTVSVVGVTVTYVVTIDGTAATVFPGFNGVQPAWINSPGLSSIPPSGTGSPAPPPPPPPPPSQPTCTTDCGGGPPAQPTAQAYIAFSQEYDDDTVSCQILWIVFTPAIGATWSVCDSVGGVDADQSIKLTDVPFPPSFAFDFDIFNEAGCSYTGTSSAPGSLNCPDSINPASCTDATEDVLTCYQLNGPQDVVVKVHCAWP